MKEIDVQQGMSLLDVSLMYYGTLERVMEISDANTLPLDYTFSERRKISIPDYSSKKAEDINTGIEGLSEWEGLLKDGAWNEEGFWCDWEWF